MKYSININQKAVVDAGFNLDLTDMAIFDVISAYTNSTACRRMSEHGRIFFNVPYQAVIEELPLAQITKPDSVYRRFQKLEQCGIMHMHPDNKRMKQVWFAWGRNYDRLHFVTGSKSGQPEKSVLRPDQNPVQTGSKSGLRPDQNPTYHNTNHYTSVYESENAPAPEKTEPLKTEKEKAPPPVPEAPLPAAPHWDAYPKANTPDELLTELRAFYFPNNKPAEHWRVLIDATPAMNWTPAKQKEVVSNFCDWALSEGWERRTFQQINARLKRWFKDEPIMAKQKQPGGPAKPSGEPAGRAYQPYQL